jgi:hypothetical protein
MPSLEIGRRTCSELAERTLRRVSETRGTPLAAALSLSAECGLEGFGSIGWAIANAGAK